MKIRKEAPQQAPELLQAPVTFHDVAAYFSEEEWKTLHQGQRERYKNVMKEIHHALFSLGHQIVNTNVLLRIGKKEKACFRDPEKREDDKDASAACPPEVQPDILFRIKQEEKLYCTNWYWSEETEICKDLPKENAVTNSDVLQRRIREENGSMKDRQHVSRKAMKDCPRTDQDELIAAGFAVPCATNLRKQEESNANLTAGDRAKGGDIDTDPTSGVPAIVKEEREKYSVHHQERKAGLSDHTDGPVVTAVMSLSLKPEAEACLQEGPKPDTADGSMNRERTAGYSVTCSEKSSPPCRASPGNAKVMMIRSSEKGTQLRRQRSSQINLEMGADQINQSDSDFRNLVHSRLQQETPKVARLGKCNDGEISLMKTQLHKCHSSTHHNWGPYPLTGSGKTFRENISFTKHQMTHPGERSYQCAECDKSFSQKVNLIRHQRTHTGERPYQCTECDKKFSHKHHLKGHQRTHTGERPYQCTKCTKSFSWKESLSRHQRTHSGERPYQCTECEQSFSLKEGLVRHQRTHMREMFTLTAEAARFKIPTSTPYMRNPKGLETVKWTIEGEKEPVFCY